MHICIKDKQWIPHWGRRTFQHFYSQGIGVRENQMWVAMSIGTMVINEGIMRGHIHAKLLSLICTNLGSWSAYSRERGSYFKNEWKMTKTIWGKDRLSPNTPWPKTSPKVWRTWNQCKNALGMNVAMDSGTFVKTLWNVELRFEKLGMLRWH